MKLHKKEEASEVVSGQPTTPVTQINNSSTFWDWISRDHPILMRLLIVIILLIIIGVTAVVSPYIPVFFIAALLFGTLVFRKTFFMSESVLVVSAYDSDPNLLDVLLIGKNKFRKFKKEGSCFPLSTSRGDPIYVSDDFSGDSLRFSWVHETSRMNYLLERDSFDKVKALAEDSTVKLHSIEHIPLVLGLTEASRIVTKHDEFFTKILHDEQSSMEDISKEALEELDEGDVRVL